jgi:hypothetical protein
MPFLHRGAVNAPVCNGYKVSPKPPLWRSPDKASQKTNGYCWRTYVATDNAEIVAGCVPCPWAFSGDMGEATVSASEFANSIPAFFESTHKQ